jgi:hypothetical protein
MVRRVGGWFTVTHPRLNRLLYYFFRPQKNVHSFVHAEPKYIHAVHNACLKVTIKFDIKMGQILKVRTCSRLRPLGRWP